MRRRKKSNQFDREPNHRPDTAPPPPAAVVLLTITVGIRMFIVRTRVMRERRIHPQAVANSRQAVERREAVRAADNLRNLFEAPVLFHSLSKKVRHNPGVR